MRVWAVERPQEFALIYGSPIPDYQAPADTIAPSARVYMLLLSILGDSTRAQQLTPPGAEPPLEAGLAEDARTLLATLSASDLAPTVLLRAITAWTQLLGAISQELFGHLDGVFRDNDRFFDHTVALMADLVGLLPRP